MQPLPHDDSRSGSAGCPSGFTIIEVLIAVLVLALVAGTALQSQMAAMRAEHRARLMTLARFELARVVTRAELGLENQAVCADAGPGFETQVGIATVEAGTNIIEFRRWTIISRDHNGTTLETLTRAETTQQIQTAIR